MTTRAAHILVDVPEHRLRMTAEVLGCFSTDPVKRRNHRIAKINSFPESERAEVKRLVNRVLLERRKVHTKKNGDELNQRRAA